MCELHCPQCGESTEELREGYCKECCETKGDCALWGECDGYEFELEKDVDCENNWYIQVRPIEQSLLYDGWWKNSSDMSLRDAVREAINGAGILSS